MSLNTTSAADEFPLTLVGDLYDGKNGDPDERRQIRDLLSRVGPTVVNFEGAFPAGRALRKAVNLPMSELVLDNLPDTILSLANNHATDFGADGLRETISRIDRKGLAWFGIESHKGAADNFRIVQVGRAHVCLVGFGWKNEECVEPTRNAPGIADFNQRNIDRVLARLRGEKYDFLVVYVHSGYEHEYYPLPLHVGLCRYLIDQGADLVFGSHTHCIQPYEIHRGKHIFYGLGNFYFSSGRERYPEESDRGLIVRLALSPATKSIRVCGVQQIRFFRHKPGFEVTDGDDYLRDHRLSAENLEAYASSYKRIRVRKRNPRPVMMYRAELANRIKYCVWLIAVRVTGYLGIRQLVKKMLGWA